MVNFTNSLMSLHFIHIENKFPLSYPSVLWFRRYALDTLYFLLGIPQSCRWQTFSPFLVLFPLCGLEDIRCKWTSRKLVQISNLYDFSGISGFLLLRFYTFTLSGLLIHFGVTSKTSKWLTDRPTEARTDEMLKTDTATYVCMYVCHCLNTKTSPTAVNV
jgi:hypothetical protein